MKNILKKGARGHTKRRKATILMINITRVTKTRKMSHLVCEPARKVAKSRV